MGHWKCHIRAAMETQTTNKAYLPCLMHRHQQRYCILNCGAVGVSHLWQACASTLVVSCVSS